MLLPSRLSSILAIFEIIGGSTRFRYVEGVVVDGMLVAGVAAVPEPDAGAAIGLYFSAKDNLLVSGTPGFMGSNPAIVKEGKEKGKQILKAEAEMAFDLLNHFSTAELTKVVASANAPNDILSFAQRKPVIENNVGPCIL